MELIFGILMFVLSFLIARWVFRVNELVDLQKKQLYILTMLAKQNGVPGEALDFMLGDSVDKLWKKYLTGVDPNNKSAKV